LQIHGALPRTWPGEGKKGAAELRCYRRRTILFSSIMIFTSELFHRFLHVRRTLADHDSRFFQTLHRAAIPIKRLSYKENTSVVVLCWLLNIFHYRVRSQVRSIVGYKSGRSIGESYVRVSQRPITNSSENLPPHALSSPLRRILPSVRDLIRSCSASKDPRNQGRSQEL
jgi:hypothetical protein